MKTGKGPPWGGMSWSPHHSDPKEDTLKLEPKDERIQRFLLRHLQAPLYRWEAVADPRDPRGQRWPLGTLLTVALWGMLAGCRTLRDVEALTEEMKETGR